ncbi:hypothetical protein ACFX14_027646 [Malus domestica]
MRCNLAGAIAAGLGSIEFDVSVDGDGADMSDVVVEGDGRLCDVVVDGDGRLYGVKDDVVASRGVKSNSSLACRLGDRGEERARGPVNQLQP